MLFFISSKILFLILFYFQGAFTQSASITGWSVAHDAHRWTTSYRIIPSIWIMSNAKRASRCCCWSQVRKCNIRRLSHTSNFGLGTRVDTPDGPNLLDGSDQTIETRNSAGELGEEILRKLFIYLTTRDIYNNLCRRQGFPNFPMSML